MDHGSWRPAWCAVSACVLSGKNFPPRTPPLNDGLYEMGSRESLYKMAISPTKGFYEMARHVLAGLFQGGFPRCCFGWFSTVKNSGRVLLYLPVFFVTHGVYGTDIFALMIYYFVQRAATHMFKNLSVLQQLVAFTVLPIITVQWKMDVYVWKIVTFQHIPPFSRKPMPCGRKTNHPTIMGPSQLLDTW